MNKIDGNFESEGGFSLLEILIAITLIGIATSTALINFQNMTYRAEINQLKSSVVLLLRDARYDAVINNRKISISDHEAEFFSDKSVSKPSAPIFVESDVFVYPSGLCAPGSINIFQKDRRFIFEVSDATCKMILLEAR